ncbi:potassium channel family protein [Flavobacterium hiemivividum]|uniref:Two pore domain potassium channel family protein n=1 Tax=Flavobacterium hiemivividum TaxID=2541734 RepID=A0A4R5CXS9_9FLAO|nr:potassium channel family protein [Flavobacterium hiemivividum]TDE05639.1 two pore domain potassium channel family protein [Flavobacterium hiemivividum]
MKKIIRKLLLGNVTKMENPQFNPIQRRIQNIKAIWNNDHQDDNGIEKIVRLFLASSQLFFPGIYIKYLVAKKGAEYEDLAVDFYVLLKVAFPLLILMNHWQNNHLVLEIMAYVMLETILYIPTLIFASDLFSKPRSYKRSMLLLFFNYIEMVFGFAVLYSFANNFNKPFTHWFDAIYFSTVTASTIGYGDFHPVDPFGKFLVSAQSMIVLMFVVLFLNFFSTKIKSKGYFDQDNPE